MSQLGKKRGCCSYHVSISASSSISVLGIILHTVSTMLQLNSCRYHLSEVWNEAHAHIWIVKIFTALFLKVGLFTSVSLPRLKGNKTRRKASLFILCWSNPKIFSHMRLSCRMAWNNYRMPLHGVGDWGERSAFQQWVCSFKEITEIPTHLERISVLPVKNHSTYLSLHILQRILNLLLITY